MKFTLLLLTLFVCHVHCNVVKERKDVCVTVSLTTGGYTINGISQDAADMSWTLGDCESNQVYSHKSTYTQQCCLEAGTYSLTCKDSAGNGWGSGNYIEIDGTTYCNDWVCNIYPATQCDDDGHGDAWYDTSVKITFAEEEEEEEEEEDDTTTVSQCSTNKFDTQIDFCNDWCNTDGKWGCGTPTLKASDARNTDGVDYQCDCAGCNGCDDNTSSYYAFDGCSNNDDSKWLDDNAPGYYSSTDAIGQVSCCSQDGRGCTRFDKNSDCLSGNNDGVSYTWSEATTMCESMGLRLCESQDELNLCCGSGCQYDNRLVWSSKTTQYYAFDGCSTNSGTFKDTLEPGYYDPETALGQVVCCNEKNYCSRKNSDGDCYSGHSSTDTNYFTWYKAQELCESEGLSLCSSQEELDACCGGGCDYDNRLVWTDKIFS